MLGVRPKRADGSTPLVDVVQSDDDPAGTDSLDQRGNVSDNHGDAVCLCLGDHSRAVVDLVRHHEDPRISIEAGAGRLRSPELDVRKLGNVLLDRVDRITTKWPGLLHDKGHVRQRGGGLPDGFDPSALNRVDGERRTPRRLNPRCVDLYDAREHWTFEPQRLDPLRETGCVRHHGVGRRTSSLEVVQSLLLADVKDATDPACSALRSDLPPRETQHAAADDEVGSEGRDHVRSTVLGDRRRKMAEAVDQRCRRSAAGAALEPSDHRRSGTVAPADLEVGQLLVGPSAQTRRVLEIDEELHLVAALRELGGEFPLAPPGTSNRRPRDEEEPHAGEVTCAATVTRVDASAGLDAPSAPPRRLVGILCTFNRPREVRRFIDVLEEQTRVPDVVVIVDNGGDPELRSFVEARDPSRRPELRYVDPGENVGPAGAFSLGLRELAGSVASDDLVVHFDDDDPPVERHQLAALCAELETATQRDALVAGIGLSGGRLRRTTGTIAPVSGVERVEAVDHLHGGYLPVYRARALFETGGNDASFFYGFEELELGRRLTQHGFKLLVFNQLMSEHEDRYRKRDKRCIPNRRINEADLDWSRFHKERNLIRVLRREGAWWAIATTVFVRHLAKPVLATRRQPLAAVRRLILGVRATIAGVTDRGGVDRHYPPPDRSARAGVEAPSWLVPPTQPNPASFQRLRRTSGSLMRELMNLEIEQVDLVGRVLDVGGGRSASYAELLRGSQSIASVNIDPSIEPTVVADLGEPLPFPDAAFDTAISFNTLEHLADDQFALNEMFRVLKPGGTAHILVPFLYRVHGHPYDFHRHTARGWNTMLRNAGVPDEAQQIRPLVWDPFATAWALADLAPLGRSWWRVRRVVRPLVLLRPLLGNRIDRRLREVESEVIADYALAYAIRASKTEVDLVHDGRKEDHAHG